MGGLTLSGLEAGAEETETALEVSILSAFGANKEDIALILEISRAAQVLVKAEIVAQGPDLWVVWPCLDLKLIQKVISIGF